jgi:hypothetical protein
VVLPRPERLDLLLMLDNSISMDVKHELFADAVRELLRRLRQPDCVDAISGAHQPSLSSVSCPEGSCPSGSTREFDPIDDINVAVISSSLGDGGGPNSPVCSRVPEQHDMAHLLGSTERGAVDSMNAQGFLEWRPGSAAAPFDGDLARMISAVGATGCGFEASLEAWFRFLADPAPYTELARVACSPGAADTDCIAPAVDELGAPLIDQVLLAQREAFLRPDSLLVIVSLSDENDCSIQPSGGAWQISDTRNQMPRAASVCASAPNDACCYSCGSEPPAGCSADPSCDARERLTNAEDAPNLRCQDQKRRFGSDFLYPTERYVRALTEPKLCLSQPSLAAQGCPGQLVDNPLFRGGRPAQHISYSSIVGVPWQHIAAEPAAPDALASFRPLASLSDGDWEQLLGRPHASPPVPPGDPFMQESTVARAGVPTGNPINGRDFDTARYGLAIPQDLQFACTFELPQPIDCGDRDPRTETCDCFEDEAASPLCEQVPGQSARGLVQYWTKAYPGLRHLEVMQGYSAHGGNGALGSVCAQDSTNSSVATFGYRPTMQALLERLQPLLREH